jgi:hypothetical protein
MRDPLLGALGSIKRLLWEPLALVAASGAAGAMWH